MDANVLSASFQYRGLEQEEERRETASAFLFPEKLVDRIAVPYYCKSVEYVRAWGSSYDEEAVP